MVVDKLATKRVLLILKATSKRVSKQFIYRCDISQLVFKSQKSPPAFRADEQEQGKHPLLFLPLILLSSLSGLAHLLLRLLW
jgi:hypothetical protein